VASDAVGLQDSSATRVQPDEFRYPAGIKIHYILYAENGFPEVMVCFVVIRYVAVNAFLSLVGP
jgi:hypothetical protein